MSNEILKLRCMVSMLLGLWLATMLHAQPARALTDPTRPAQYRPAAKAVSFNLESILFSESRRVAVINGKVLAEGETIDGARVLSISKDTVRLLRGGKSLPLTLRRPSIRQEK